VLELSYFKIKLPHPHRGEVEERAARVCLPILSGDVFEAKRKGIPPKSGNCRGFWAGPASKRRRTVTVAIKPHCPVERYLRWEGA